MSETIVREYTPSATGKAFMKSDKHLRSVMGPIGSGKSVLCVIEILRRCMMQKIGPDGKRRSRWAIVRNTAPQLKDTTLKTWFDWVPPGAAGKWVASDKTFLLSFGDVEAEIMFRPLDTPDDVGRVLSLELTGAWVNECREIPQELIDALQGRLKRYPSQINGGFSWSGMIMDTNPPPGDSWWQATMDNPPSNWESFFQPSGVSPEAENRNNLAPDYYEELMIGKAQEWIDVYVHGKYGKSKAGKPVYKQSFNDDIHVVPHLTPIPNEPILIGMDFGLTPCGIIGQLDSYGRLLLLEEMVSFDMGIERFIDTRMNPVLRTRYASNPVLCIGDPTGSVRVQTNEGSVFRSIRNKGYKVIGAPSNNLAPRIGAVEHFLTLLVNGKGGMLIDKTKCPMIISGFKGGYRYAKIKGNGEERYKDTPDKNDFSHIHDAVQYLSLYAKQGHMSGSMDNPLNNQALPPQTDYTPGVWSA